MVLSNTHAYVTYALHATHTCIVLLAHTANVCIYAYAYVSSVKTYMIYEHECTHIICMYFLVQGTAYFYTYALIYFWGEQIFLGQKATYEHECTHHTYHLHEYFDADICMYACMNVYISLCIHMSMNAHISFACIFGCSAHMHMCVFLYICTDIFLGGMNIPRAESYIWASVSIYHAQAYGFHAHNQLSVSM